MADLQAIKDEVVNNPAGLPYLAMTEANAVANADIINIWTSGVLAGQATDITVYNGTSKLLTFTGVTDPPSNSDTFIIV